MTPYEYVKKKPKKYWICSKCNKKYKKIKDGCMEVIEVETVCSDCTKKSQKKGGEC